MVILSVAACAFLSALCGLIVRRWKSAPLVLLVSVPSGNPALYVPLSPLELTMVVLFAQLLVACGFAHLFSRIGLRPVQTS